MCNVPIHKVAVHFPSPKKHERTQNDDRETNPQCPQTDEIWAMT